MANTVTTGKKSFDFKAFFKNNISSLVPYFGLVLCLVLFSIIPPFTTGGNLFAKRTFAGVINSSFVLLILSLGAIFIYSMGSMDISVGASAGVAGLIIVPIQNAIYNASGNPYLGAAVGCLVALIAVVAFAAVNASVGEFLHLPAIIGSLFLMFFGGGLQLIVFTHAESFTLLGDFSMFKNTVLRIVIILVFALMTYYLFNYTKLGKYSRAIGINETVVKQTGVNTWMVKWLCYSFLGLAVVIATFFATVDVSGIVNKSTGNGYHMNIMIALILGGMPLSGGSKSKISAAIVGTFTFVLLDKGLVLSGVDTQLVALLKAIIFITIVGITCRKKGTLLPR